MLKIEQLSLSDFASRSIRKSSSVSEVIALWMGYPGVPDSLKSNPIFIGVLSITTLALLSPRSLKIIPDSAGEILNIFQNKGFYRVISKSKLLEIIDDPLIVEQGIQFLINRKLVDIVDEDSYKLLEIPLTNLRIKFD
ncbi:MAG: hypothetical protein QJT81_02125 [Candidatus Thiothrix putei]|uniref:Uncharacterized protein n=1 Tax=Candidatus Thiothrix putei TaxID=3080811 RepID=A0AA95HF72_9GAMM|nr:MAG: hypothetical protein QJT81_02125 [Candidatus Thiothrix putei]